MGNYQNSDYCWDFWFVVLFVVLFVKFFVVVFSTINTEFTWFYGSGHKSTPYHMDWNGLLMKGADQIWENIVVFRRMGAQKSIVVVGGGTGRRSVGMYIFFSFLCLYCMLLTFFSKLILLNVERILNRRSTILFQPHSWYP